MAGKHPREVKELAHVLWSGGAGATEIVRRFASETIDGVLPYEISRRTVEGWIATWIRAGNYAPEGDPEAAPTPELISEELRRIVWREIQRLKRKQRDLGLDTADRAALIQMTKQVGELRRSEAASPTQQMEAGRRRDTKEKSAPVLTLRERLEARARETAPGPHPIQGDIGESGTHQSTGENGAENGAKQSEAQADSGEANASPFPRETRLRLVSASDPVTEPDSGPVPA